MIYTNLSWDGVGDFIITTEPRLSSPSLKTNSIVRQQEPNIPQIILLQRDLD